MKRLLCFDLDGTLTQHRSPLEEENRRLLDRLAERYHLLMVGAGAAERIFRQMGEYPIPILGNYGMEEGAVTDGRFRLVRRETSCPDRAFFLEKAEYLRKKYGYTAYDGEGVEFHGSGMVTLPLLGTAAPIEKKLAFDPDRARRRVMYPEVSEIFRDYAVYIGGTSSFDFAERRFNKHSAILRYAEREGFSRKEILFVGDDFGDGGGDSHVRLFGMDYIEIRDYRTLPHALAHLL